MDNFQRHVFSRISELQQAGNQPWASYSIQNMGNIGSETGAGNTVRQEVDLTSDMRPSPGSINELSGINIPSALYDDLMDDENSNDLGTAAPGNIQQTTDTELTEALPDELDEFSDDLPNLMYA